MAIAASMGFLAGFSVRSGAAEKPASKADPASTNISPPPPSNPKDVEPDQNSLPLDLSKQFNADLFGGWHTPGSPNDLSELPSGLQPMLGTKFDIQGIIQLGGVTQDKPWGAKYPPSVPGIKVGTRCRRLQFLLGTGLVERDGLPIGKVVVRYADAQTREIPVVYGRHVRDWWFDPKLPRPKGGVVAWSGLNQASRLKGMAIQLYKVSWENPLPDLIVDSIDLVSLMTDSAPFFIAATADVPGN